MKIAIDEALELEFDGWALEKAAEELKEIARKNGDRGDQKLRAMFTVLLFGQIEKHTPRSTATLLHCAETMAKCMSPPEPETDK